MGSSPQAKKGGSGEEEDTPPPLRCCGDYPFTVGRSNLGSSHAEAKVRLENLGIPHLKPKIATTGAMILKVPGENSATRADQLHD